MRITVLADPSVFRTSEGRRLYRQFASAVADGNMLPKFQKGVVVAFSGGADSVFLLDFIFEFCKNNGNFPLLALHVHHGIRGEEADRDAAFCADVCRRMGIKCIVLHRDAPLYAKTHGIGLEEAARIIRYEALRSCLADGAYGCIVTAHHATDQLETVLFHMMRGSGTQGLCGMSATSGDILRPLLTFSKSTIVKFLEKENVAYVEDSTNFSTAPMRNYIRHEILPHLAHLTPHPEQQITRLTHHLQTDADLLNQLAEQAYTCKENGRMSCAHLRDLHPALAVRVIRRWVQTITDKVPETIHFDTVCRLLQENRAFSYNLPGGVTVSSDRNEIRLEPTVAKDSSSGVDPGSAASESIPLHMGWQHFPEHGFSFYLSDEKPTEDYINVYKISIKADLSSAIINGAMFLRFRKEGDAYAYGGMTHRLKRLFSDRHYTASCRRALPILCDASGIIWVPGFGVRSDCTKGACRQSLYAVFCAHDTFADGSFCYE